MKVWNSELSWVFWKYHGSFLGHPSAIRPSFLGEGFALEGHPERFPSNTAIEAIHLNGKIHHKPLWKMDESGTVFGKLKSTYIHFKSSKFTPHVKQYVKGHVRRKILGEIPKSDNWKTHSGRSNVTFLAYVSETFWNKSFQRSELRLTLRRLFGDDNLQIWDASRRGGCFAQRLAQAAFRIEKKTWNKASASFLPGDIAKNSTNCGMSMEVRNVT